MKAIKRIAIYAVVAVFLCLLLSVAVSQYGSNPPNNALVYVDQESGVFYPPHATPSGLDWQPTSFAEAKKQGYKPSQDAEWSVSRKMIFRIIQMVTGAEWWWWNGSSGMVETVGSADTQ